MAGGRPSSYKQEYCDQIVQYFKEGWSIEEICIELVICKQTFYNWCESNSEFLDSKKKGESFSQGWWMRQGRVNLENKDFSATLFYMNMKNRFGWKDRQDVTTNDKDVQPVVVNLGTGVKPDGATS